MKTTIAVLALLAVSPAWADETVTLDSLHREMQELKSEIRGLRQEVRGGGIAARQRRMGTNDVDRVQRDNRPPSDPEARKAWFAERRKAHEARMKARREKHAEKGARSVSTEQKADK